MNAPELGAIDEFELTPVVQPTVAHLPVDMGDSVQVAFQNRPEIHQAMKQVKAAAVRMDMSKNELLPALDLLLETYTAGLRGDSDIGRAWSDQFSTGAPSYSAGLQFEVPLRNRESRARYQRRVLETRQLQNQFRSTLHALQLEVEIAVREVQTTFREIEAKHQAMMAAESEVDYISARWQALPGEDRSASLVLEDLLAAQDRLAANEFEFLEAQVAYNLAMINLKRVTGTLLRSEQVAIGETECDGIPALELQKAGPSLDVPLNSAAAVP